MLVNSQLGSSRGYDRFYLMTIPPPRRASIDPIGEYVATNTTVFQLSFECHSFQLYLNLLQRHQLPWHSRYHTTLISKPHYDQVYNFSSQSVPIGKSKEFAPSDMDIPRERYSNVARETAVNPRARSCKGIPRNAMISMAARQQFLQVFLVVPILMKELLMVLGDKDGDEYAPVELFVFFSLDNDGCFHEI